MINPFKRKKAATSKTMCLCGKPVSLDLQARIDEEFNDTFAKGGKKAIMWAVFRKPGDKYPETIYNRYRDANHVAWGWRKDYWWGKNAYVRRIEIDMSDFTSWHIMEHEYKHIKNN